MNDWKAIAKARAIPLDDAQADRIESVLKQLETDFGALKNTLSAGDQPATVFVPLEGEGQ